MSKKTPRVEFWLNDHDLLFPPFCTRETVVLANVRTIEQVPEEYRSFIDVRDGRVHVTSHSVGDDGPTLSVIGGNITIPGESPAWVRGVYWLAIARGEVQVNEPKLAAQGPDWKRFLLFLQHASSVRIAIDTVVRLGSREQAWRFVGERFDEFNDRMRVTPVMAKLAKLREQRARRLALKDGGFGPHVRPGDEDFVLEALPPKVKR